MKMQKSKMFKKIGGNPYNVDVLSLEFLKNQRPIFENEDWRINIWPKLERFITPEGISPVSNEEDSAIQEELIQCQRIANMLTKPLE